MKRDANGWTKVSDGLPPGGHKILYYTPFEGRGGNTWIVEAEHDPAKEREKHRQLGITHWQLLPQPPLPEESESA